MSWLYTSDERYIGSTIAYAAGYFDAPYSLATTYKLAPRSYGYGTVTSITDYDVYSLGILNPGNYAAAAIGYNWDLTNQIPAISALQISLFDQNGIPIASSNQGFLWFTVSQASTYYLAVGCNTSSEYAVLYTPNYLGSMTINISGITTVSQTLTATYTVSDINGAIGIAPTYQWARSSDGINWTNISGANQLNYTIQSADSGKYLRFGIAYTDNDGFAESFVSLSTTKVIADTTNPTVLIELPTSGSLGSVCSDFNFLFSERIYKGSGNILLKQSNGDIVESFDITSSSRISINNELLTINPTSDLSYDSQYTIVIPNTCISDFSGNFYTQPSSFIFKTGSAPSTALPIEESYPLTGDSLIDAMTNGYKWTLSNNKVIDWSISNGFSGEYWNNPDAVIDHIKSALDVYSYYTNIHFNYLGYFKDPTDAVAYGSDINIAMDGSNKYFSNAATWAFGLFPNAAYNKPEFGFYNGAAGDIYLNILSDANTLSSYEPGSAGWSLIIHEIGHTLGLKHPHDDGGSGRPTFSSLGIQNLNIDWASVMSYNDTAQFNLNAWDPASPMILDVLALQYLYGKNPYTNSGDTTFNLFETNYYATLWDASGIDTLDASAASKGWTIYLPNSTLTNLVDTKVGFAAPTSDLVGTPTTIDWLAGDFENIIATSFDDYILGNDFANTIVGGLGNDYLFGGSGNDTLYGGNQNNPTTNQSGVNLLSGGGGNDLLIGGGRSDIALYTRNRSYYSIDYMYGSLTVIDQEIHSDSEGTDTIIGINLIRFADSTQFFCSAAQRTIITGAETSHNITVSESKLYNSTSATETFTLTEKISPMILAGDGDSINLLGRFESYTFASHGSQLQVFSGDYVISINIGGNVHLNAGNVTLDAHLSFEQNQSLIFLGNQTITATEQHLVMG